MNRNTNVLGQFDSPLCCNVFGAFQHTLAALFNRFFHSVKGSRWQEELLITSLCRVCSSLVDVLSHLGSLCCVITFFLLKHFLLSFEIDWKQKQWLINSYGHKQSKDGERFRAIPRVCETRCFCAHVAAGHHRWLEGTRKGDLTGSSMYGPKMESVCMPLRLMISFLIVSLVAAVVKLWGEHQLIPSTDKLG